MTRNEHCPTGLASLMQALLLCCMKHIAEPPTEGGACLRIVDAIRSLQLGHFEEDSILSSRTRNKSTCQPRTSHRTLIKRNKKSQAGEKQSLGADATKQRRPLGSDLFERLADHPRCISSVAAWRSESAFFGVYYIQYKLFHIKFIYK